MSPDWDEKKVLEGLGKQPQAFLCDVLLDQNLFAGVGNIIKNEVLFRLHLHPETRANSLSADELQLLARETRLYSLQFYHWKKDNLLRKNWKIFRKKKCPNCERAIELRPTGLLDRRNFTCTNCQPLRKRASKSPDRSTTTKSQLRITAAQLRALLTKINVLNS